MSDHTGFLDVTIWILSILSIVLCKDSEVRDTGPYFIPDWNTPTFRDNKEIGKSDVLIYDDSVQAKLFSSRSWRFVYTWAFLNRHYTEVNNYVITPPVLEAEEWVNNAKCKVGTTYETSREDDCYKNLDEQTRSNWVGPQVLKTNPPAMRPYMSTCSIYYSCDIHDVSFPIYINQDSFKPYISGPHGENIDISGDGSTKIQKMDDSFLVYKSVKKSLRTLHMETDCIWQGEIQLETKIFCNYVINNNQYTIIFEKGKKKTAFNNIVFYRPTFPKKVHFELWDPADPATKGDLHELEAKTLLMSKDNTFLYHEIIQELSNVKHILRNLILSVAKVDDNLIGKITRIPVKTKWLNDEIFVLNSNLESLIHTLPDKRTSCLGSYTYMNGRWKIATDHEKECSNWNSTSPLRIMDNVMRSPLEILNAPEYRNASNSYSGWTFLDNGQVSLDWLDKGLKYYKPGGGFDFKFNGFNLMSILTIVLYIIISVVILFLVCFLLRSCR